MKVNEDTDGKAGYNASYGLGFKNVVIRRMQDSKNILLDVLTGSEEAEIIDKIIEFPREYFVQVGKKGEVLNVLTT